MFSGYFTAASGLLTQERRLNVVSNNISNMKTPGYHAQRGVTTTFDHEMMVRMEGGKTPLQSASPISVLEEVFAEMQQGDIQGTNRFLDMAIEGEGFFTIRKTDADGVQTDMYSRNGNFDIDDEGYLVLRGAGRVMGEKGEIKIDTENYVLYPNGEIHTDAGFVDKLSIVIPPEGVNMQRFANGLYVFAQAPGEDGVVPEAGEEPIRGVSAEFYQVHQMSLEGSNVNMNRETALLMETQRAYQACAAALKIMDTMNQKAANKIAAIS